MTSSQQSQRTFGNEEHLPRVPVPTLVDSCERFLDWCAPLLTEEQLARTEAAVAAFLAPDSPAHELQAALEEYDSRPDVASWLEEFWAYRYLGRRDRIALNANFFFLFHGSGEDQVERAAGLVAGAVDYKLRLDDESVPPVVQRGRPLSMAQQRFLFATTRIPGATQDSVRAPFTAEHPGPSTARHIVVFFRGTPFRLDVLDSDGRPHGRDDLAAALRALLKGDTRRGEPGTEVGHLTTMARAEWAAARTELLAADAGNAAALDELESALFCLCLEETVPADATQAADQLLHGDSGNRWFDKSFSLVVFGDGTAGINVEHCGLDGTTVLSFVDTLLGDRPAARATAAGVPEAVPVRFALDEGLRERVRAAAASFAGFAAATATSTLSFDFGSDRAKRLGMSPDAFVQMAYQLAHRRAKGITGATYESIATRQYRHGRTEAMRVVTPEVLHFVSIMDDPAADRVARRAAFEAAAAKHVARAKECQAGAAPEQHLWELLLIAGRRGVTEPLDLYTSPGWLVMRDDYLSTSSAPSENIQYFGFGSTSPQCIGIAYVLLPDRLNIYLSTRADVAEQMHRFARELAAALEELAGLLASE
ncbi:choline/carnitine O-acyltransferase [Actinophytocola xanthii]|uniref:Carnitine O-acetyltransferase n=1 Tax=Actinophytocola xanthii TaxID=1912961 RepID=A0A1Q8C1J2_9PSEU|nr:choline/carnitine O-acyltransferase [Actinophytocola xanthii]OLF08228.1 carnitine O-acetyltransferase [Actinophytocola xanthii]